MAKQTIDISTPQINGRQGEAPRTAFTKVNQNFDELYDADERSLKKDKNLSDVANTADARNNLGLGGAATRDVGASLGQLMEVGAFGLGAYTINNNSNFQAFSQFNPNTLPIGYPGNAYEYGAIIRVFHGYAGDVFELVSQHTTNSPLIFRHSRTGTWQTIYHTGNTTVDSNGFIKRASPIVKLFSDSIEKTEHLEIAEAELERLGVGHYVLHNVPSLSKDGWYIETPKDRNNNIYFYLDYVANETDKTLTIKTYEPDYSSGRAEAGAPMDIIDGRFVSLRFEEDPSLYPELEEPKTEEEEEE